MMEITVVTEPCEWESRRTWQMGNIMHYGLERRLMMDNPKVVVLCGSSRFCDIMAICAWLIERDEKAITMGLHLLPEWYCQGNIPDHLAEYEGVAEEMDTLHLRKIDMANEIFVVNFLDYIGKSTTREVEYASANGKNIRWFSHDPIGEGVMQIIQKKQAKLKAEIEQLKFGREPLLCPRTDK